jgi:hypothetical protein
MKRMIAVGILMIATLGFGFSEAIVGTNLEAYKIISASQMTEKALAEKVTRNELYIWIHQVTKNLEAPTKSVKFTDIIPNTNFDGVAKRMASLELLLPDQLAGLFKPSKEVTYEEASSLALRLIGYSAANSNSNSLQAAYEAGLLTGIRINTVNQVVSKKSFYVILENTLKAKRLGSELSVKDYLKLATPSDNGLKPTIDLGAVVQKFEVYNAEEFFVTFSGAPSEQSRNLIQIYDAKNTSLKIIGQRMVKQDAYLYKVSAPLVTGEQYEIRGTVAQKSEYNNGSKEKLFCIEEMSVARHNRQIKLTFNHKLDVNSALDLRNYQSKTGLDFKSIDFDRNRDGSLDLQTVLIETGEQVTGKAYTIILQDGLKDAFGNMPSVLLPYRQITIYGAAYDVYPPKVDRIIPKGINEMVINFSETSGLDVGTAENPKSYSVYDIDAKKSFVIESAKLKKNETTGVYSEVVLKVAPLDRLKRYMVEVVGVKDVLGNVISTTSDYRGSFALSTEEEKSARLVLVEAYSRDLIKLVFNKNIQIPTDFTMENIQLTSGAKALSVTVDKSNASILWVKSTESEKTGMSVVKIENIYDAFGNRTTFGDASQYYAPNRSDLERPVVGLVENNRAYGKNVLTINFSKAMSETALEQVSHYSINGLDVLYVYKTSDYKVKVVTSAQQQGKIYDLTMSDIVDQFGAPLSSGSTSKTFIGNGID